MKAIYRPDGILLQNMRRDEVDKINTLIAEMEAKNKLNKNILPRPVVCDGKGKLTKNYSSRDWYLKLLEKILEVMKAVRKEETSLNYDYEDDVAEEIADIITVCISQLEALGYGEKARSEIFARVNEKNEKRGYFKE